MDSDRSDFFGDLIEGMLKCRLDFILCGGMAAVLHGVERTTLDLDISVSLEPQNVTRLLAAMEELGLRPRVPVNPAILADQTELEKLIREKQAFVFTFDHPRDPLLHVDVFLPRHLRYEHLVKDAVEKPFRGWKLKVLSARKLMELKKAVRPIREKDRMDIAILEKILREQEEG